MIGSIAAVLTTFAFLPQVIKVIKSKDTESIALGMYLMQVLGIALWLAHCLVIQDLPLILANSVSFILSGIILVYKIRYK
ncbi:SemiSWEET transporter [Streptococcus gordonii]|uniref:SemiSWEET transporter n=1 Tax=Streptococcus gordonii TaxID=1302 RepID=UPI0007796EC2|nr:SemiSWEET transporter [Streptococcus gordonii]MBZ2122696.1 SemiSWEET transporter [Streptococcus gordonii]MBZ2147198.1 SemiSWEET transporter [Streptococcus gordonii]MBZ2150788.1 SemiSWEET transporter [Streptococcus gordonii]QWZ58707.1 SemiSWEET transporter [Streptococcus gordonii]